MTAPFSPELTSPANKGGVDTTTLTVKAKFRTFVAGDSAGSYQLRRRQMAPTIGAYEYWNATSSTWVASAVDNTLTAATYYDGSVITVVATPGTAGSVYQWSMATKNSAAELGPYAPDSLYQTHSVPTMTLSVPTNISRPRVRWVTGLASGYYMRSYQVAAYTAAVRNAPGFDPSLASWQAQATYLTPLKYSSSDYYVDPTNDMVSGVQYYWYYKIQDNSELSSGWVLGTNVTMSFTSPQAPSVSITPDIANGNVGIIARSAFNLVPDASSTFPTDRGSWVETLNADAIWDSATSRLNVIAAGMSYAALDAAQTTYTAQDTAYSTNAVQAATQASPTLTTRVVTGTALGQYYVASPSTPYSAIMDAFTNASGRFAKISFLWFQTGGAASAITAKSAGTATSLPAGSTVQVRNFNVTSPADAAWFALEIEITSPPVGESFFFDNIAAATATSVQWSPANLVDVSFVIEKSKDNWATYEGVWNFTRNSPRPSDVGVLTQVILTDRSPYLGVQAWQYRVYAISNFSTSPIWSAPTYIDGPAMAPEAWWFKNTQFPAYDVRPKVSAFQEGFDIADSTYTTENSKYPVFVQANEPDLGTYDLTVIVLTEDDHKRVMNSIASKATLFIQTNTEGIGHYFRPSGSGSKRQMKSTSDQPWKTMRSSYEISFRATKVAPYEG